MNSGNDIFNKEYMNQFVNSNLCKHFFVIIKKVHSNYPVQKLMKGKYQKSI